jgi:hypothetical protein
MSEAGSAQLLAAQQQDGDDQLDPHVEFLQQLVSTSPLGWTGAARA